MQIKKLFVIGAVALAAGSAFADDASAPISRQDVVNAVLQARAAGTLAPAGEGVDASARTPMEARSTRTLADSAAEVRQARADGTLRHAGEASPEESARYERANPSTSTLTRAEVKAEVIAARRAGELIPAGEGDSWEADRAYARGASSSSRVAMGRDRQTPVAVTQ